MRRNAATHTTRPAILLWLLLLAFLAGQIAYSQVLRPLRAGIEEMPPPLSANALKLLAFGDDQLLFRAMAHWLQDVGDGGGRLRPLRDFDYDRVVAWLKTLDHMDARSDYSYELAAHYFGAITADPSRRKKIVVYLRDVGMADPAGHWTWLVWAAVTTGHGVDDCNLAAGLADDLVSLRGRADVPDWLPLMAIRLYRLAGNDAAAKALESDPRLMDARRRVTEELAKRLGQTSR